MNTETPASIRNRRPFQPFSVRVNSGAVYGFQQPEQFGPTGDLQVIVHFGQSRFSIIDAESTTEVIKESANG